MNEQLIHKNTDFPQRQFPIILICDQVNAPANIGSLFRVADSFGIEKIYFCGEDINIQSKRMERTSRATHKTVPYEIKKDTQELILAITSKGYIPFTLEITDSSVPITQCDFLKTEKIALIIGEERSGVSSNVLQQVKKSIHIDMFGTNSSMNVATAAAIALYEITKQMV